MKQYMQFDEEPSPGGYQGSASIPEPQEEFSADNYSFERASTQRPRRLSLSYPRAVKLLGLLLLVLGILLIIGLALSMIFSYIFLLVMIAIVVDVLFFLGFWLLFRKRKIPTPHD